MLKIDSIDRSGEIIRYVIIADTKAEVGATDQDIITDLGLDLDHLPMGSIIYTTDFAVALIDSDGTVNWKE